jgi:hypothetical protein
VSTSTSTLTDTLDRLDPARVGVYLTARGWEEMEPGTWVQDGAMVLLPDPLVSDQPGWWRDLVETIAYVEDRSPAEVYADLIVTPADLKAASHPVCQATARTYLAALAQLRQLAEELRVAAAGGHSPTAEATAELRQAAEETVKAAVAAATATAEVVRSGDTTITADPAATDPPPS